jgi:hypothetical protein
MEQVESVLLANCEELRFTLEHGVQLVDPRGYTEINGFVPKIHDESANDGRVNLPVMN